MAVVQAHRGASGYAPENTLASFRRAVRMGADGIECDIYMSKDGEYVVCHDPTIDRTSNASGEIGDWTLADLKKLDFGAKFAPEYKDERIPTLHEMLCVVHDMEPINIEIKSLGQNSPEEVDAFYNFLAEEHVIPRVLISCFNADLLGIIKKQHPDLRCGYLCWGENVAVSVEKAVSLHLDAIHPDWENTTKEIVDHAHKEGLIVNAWTCNSEEEIRKMLDIGCDGIITNYPDRAMKLNREMNR